MASGGLCRRTSLKKKIRQTICPCCSSIGAQGMNSASLCRRVDCDALGGVDSKDSLLGANQIQGCFWGGSLGCDGAAGFERRGVGADGAADHRSTCREKLS